ncbi:MAG: HNH endonuclease [Chloroflexota bacterium]
MAEQAQHRCGYCLSREALTGSPLVIDHLIPEALGGPIEEENLWLACGQCNLHKGDRIASRDPVTDAWAPLFNADEGTGSGAHSPPRAEPCGFRSFRGGALIQEHRRAVAARGKPHMNRQ